MVDRFADKVAFITGAGSGIGKSIALRFASEGASVICADIDESTAEATAELARRSGGLATGLRLDVACEKSYTQAASKVSSDAGGGLHILVNNAACVDREIVNSAWDLSKVTVESWDQVMAVNLRGTMLGCKYMLPLMLEQRTGGAVVNMGSRAGLVGDDRATAYGASKAAIHGLTRHIATMYGQHNIRCNTVIPASVDTDAALQSDSNCDRAMKRAERLLPDAPHPDDIAKCVAFLASADAAAITGQSIIVDGGVTAHRPMHALRRWRLDERSALDGWCD